MRRFINQLRFRSLLNNLTSVHDINVFREITNRSKVVGDVNNCQVMFFRKVRKILKFQHEQKHQHGDHLKQ